MSTNAVHWTSWGSCTANRTKSMCCGRRTGIPRGYFSTISAPGCRPELLFATDRYDAGGVVTACIARACVDGDEDPRLVGFHYVGDGPEIYYIDEGAAALQQAIDAALPPGTFNAIHDRAADDKYIVIRSMGPQEPGRYYLLRDRTNLQLLAATTAVEPEQLGERRVLWYEARDGMRLNAVLTLPTSGEPPYPTIAHPHGGPSPATRCTGIQPSGTSGRSCWPRAATRCSSPTSAAQPALATSISPPATGSGPEDAGRCG